MDNSDSGAALMSAGVGNHEMSQASERAVYESAIVWNGIPLLTPLTGVGHYTAHLLRALTQPQTGPDIQVFLARRWKSARALFNDDDFSASLPAAEAAVARARLWRRVLGRVPMVRRLVRARQAIAFREGCLLQQAALYHEPNFIAYPFDGPTVVTVHDLSFIRYPQTHPAERVRFMTEHLPRSLQQASTVIVVSDFIREELIHHFGDSIASKISVVLNGVSSDFVPRPAADPALQQALLKRGLHYKKFLLSVGTLEPRKNLSTLLHAYAALPATLKAQHPLVIVGPSGWHTAAFEKLLHRYRHESIRLLGYVDQKELPLLYAAATGLIYPSFYEGFGLPVAEAMACGTPVIAADASALPQVLVDCGQLIAPDDEKGFTSAMVKLISDQPFAQLCAERGVRRAEELSWDRAAGQIRGIYRALLSKP